MLGLPFWELLIRTNTSDDQQLYLIDALFRPNGTPPRRISHLVESFFVRTAVFVSSAHHSSSTIGSRVAICCFLLALNLPPSPSTPPAVAQPLHSVHLGVSANFVGLLRTGHRARSGWREIHSLRIGRCHHYPDIQTAQQHLRKMQAQRCGTSLPGSQSVPTLIFSPREL